MADKAKGPVLLLILFLLIAICIMGLSFVALQKERQNSVTLSKKIEEVEAMKRLAEDRVDDLNKQVAELGKSVKDAEERLSAVNEELGMAEKAKEDALIEASQLKEELEAAIKTKAGLETKLKVNDDTLKKAQGELAAIKTERDGLQQKLKDLESKNQRVQLEKIVVPSTAEGAQGSQPQSDASGKAGAATIEGKILVVNKDYDFIVINLGRKDNVNIGDSLEVWRKNKKIGQVKIEEVRDTMSVATPVSKGLTQQAKEEDRVVYK